MNIIILIFNNFNNKINVKIEEYNNIVKSFNLNITLIKHDYLNKDIIKNYLSPLKNWVGLMLNQKFENVILKAGYDYYKLNLETKLGDIFSDIFGRWRNMFETLENDVSEYEEYIQYSFFEFSNMAEIYRTIIQTDYIENYFNSIILLERTELNYTISYYYNYILKLLDKYYKYTIQKVPTDRTDHNIVLLEIENIFNSLSENISQSEIDVLNLKNQMKICGVNETDFFEVKNILTENVKNISDSLEDIEDFIYMYEMFADKGNEYSLVMRYYLENKELGKTIEAYYEPLDKGEFIYLNLNKFKDIMLENWIFNSEDFVNILNNALYETNKEINNDLSMKLENFTGIIDNEISGFFENIENIISNLFLSQVKEFTIYQKKYINNITLEIINEFETKIRTEAKRIKNNPQIYNLNIKNIENSIKDYKNYIYSKINISIFDLLDRFYENVNKNIFTNCIKNKSDDYLNQAKNIMSSYGEYPLLNSSIKIGEVIYKLVEDVIGSYKIILSKKIYLKYEEYYEKLKLSIDLQRIYNLIDNHLDIIYENYLLPELTNENNCSSVECPLFDFNQETKVNINNMILEKTYKIKNESLLLKQDNYEANYQCNVQFADSYEELLSPLCETLKQFLSFEKEEQISRINEFIQNAIKSNLDDFLNNVVPAYGNRFFERIIDYNINFKIVDLYENLHYGISKTLLYYHTLKIISEIDNLPYDLKIRLYNLNNLDITVINKVEDIKELLEKKLSELIIDLKDIAKNTYTKFLQKDQLIKNSFSPNVLEKIDFSLENIMPDLEKDYQISLEKYLKEKFMDAFTDVLDQKTDYMLKIFYEEKDKLKERLDDIFSSKEDRDLNEINKNINLTLESIQSYRNFLSSFKISESAKLFFINYSNNTLLPLFKKFNSDFNKKMSGIIMTTINSNSKQIEKLNPIPFIEKTNDIFDYLSENYINYINRSIIDYGKYDYIYKNNLNRTIEKNRNNFRRRLRTPDNNEKEIEEEMKNRIESKYVEETLEILVNKTRNIKLYVDTLNSFITNEEILQGYKNNINIDKKNIKERITNNKYNEEIDIFLREKLENLTSILINYYDYINSNFCDLKNNLQFSIKRFSR